MDSYDNDFLFIDELLCVYVDFREQDKKDLQRIEQLWEELLLEETK